MTIGLQGQNLIFLISQPRAGSTLLQRILGSHPDVHIVSEPWLMLRPLYALRAGGGCNKAEYDTRAARNGLQDFLQALPGGEDDYVEGVRRMYAYLYERALTGSGKRYFLDKTPQYYAIIPELYRVFPQARYIILLRNPLAVLCSLYTKWAHRALLRLHDRSRLHLIKAPQLLLEGIRVLGDQGTVVHYERLVREPEREIQRLCDDLGIGFDPAMIEYGHHALPRWKLGDQKVYDYTRPVARIAESWTETIADPQAWQLANGYLDTLGRETVEQMGYSYRELQQTLKVHRPHRTQLWFTFPLVWLLKKPAQERTRLARGIVWFVCLIRTLQRRGLRGAMALAKREVKKRYIPMPYLRIYWRIRNWFHNLHHLKWHSPVLVYQMGKVGSTSIYESLLACRVEVVHFHEMEPLFMREIARKDRVEIVTLVREPIGRQISEFFQNFDQHTGVDYAQDAFDLAALHEIFMSKRESWQPHPWFDREMKDNLGIDVYEYPFPQEKGWLVIESGNCRILILKLELDDAVKEQVISDFLNLSNFELIHANVAQDKAYAETYRAFLQTIRLPEAYVEVMCNARYTRHFYSEAEIEDMRSKWLRKAQAAGVT